MPQGEALVESRGIDGDVAGVRNAVLEKPQRRRVGLLGVAATRNA
jgi:hypothetical protein